MKLFGGMLMAGMIPAMAQVGSQQFAPDREWIKIVASGVVTGVFLFGLLLFGHAIKREAVEEVRARSGGTDGSA